MLLQKKERESIDSKPICVSKVRDGGGKKTFTFLFQRPQQPHWQGIVNPSLPFAQQTKVVQTSDFSSFTTASKATHKHSLKEIQTWSNNDDDDDNWCRKLQANKRKKPWLKKNQNRGKSYCTPHQKKWIKKYGNTSATGAYRWPKDNEERKRKNQIKKQRTEACRCKQSFRDAKRKGSQRVERFAGETKRARRMPESSLFTLSCFFSSKKISLIHGCCKSVEIVFLSNGG